MEHIKLTKEGFTHWSSGPGNPTFDPECGACWEAEVERLRGELREKDRSIAVVEEYRLTGLDTIAALERQIKSMQETESGEKATLLQLLSKLHTQVHTIGPEKDYADMPIFKEVEEALTPTEATQ